VALAAPALVLGACGGRAYGPSEDRDSERAFEDGHPQRPPAAAPPTVINPSPPNPARPLVPIEVPGMAPIATVVPTALPAPRDCLLGSVDELCLSYPVCDLNELAENPEAQVFLAQYLGCAALPPDAGPCGRSVYDLTCTCYEPRTGRSFTRLDLGGGYSGVSLYYALDQGSVPLVGAQVWSDTNEYCSGTSFSAWYGQVLECACGERR
jgi:hypothetical protein